MLKRIFAAVLVFGMLSNVGAELPPSAYEEMQSKAPEVVRVNVLTVTKSDGPTLNAEKIDVLVEVLKIGRTTAGIKPGDIFTISYEHTRRQSGFVGPGEVPILEENSETVAFLKPIEGSPDYAPAAGAMSFELF